MAPPEIAMNQPVRIVAPDGAVSPAAGPAESPVPPPISAKDALLAAVWDYKDRYGLAVLCMAGALAWLYYNYWKPSRPHQTPAAAAAEWEEKRRLAVERQQAKLREGTAAFLQKQMEENERQKEKRRQRSEADAKRLGMEHLAKQGQKLGHGPAQQATGPSASAAAAEDWLS